MTGSSKGYFFEDFALGQRFETEARTVTEADVVAYSGTSGDFNALHTDAVFAASGPFGQRIAHGTLVLAIVTGLRNRLGILDGTLVAFLEIRSWKFLAPVFLGDTVRAVNEIIELRETSRADRGVVVQRVSVIKQDGTVVQEGEFVSLVLRRDR